MEEKPPEEGVAEAAPAEAQADTDQAEEAQSGAP